MAFSGSPSLLLASLLVLPILLRAEAPQASSRLSEVGASRDFVRFASVGMPADAEGRTRKVGERVRSWDPEFVIAPGAEGYPDGGAEVLCPPEKDGHYDVARGPVHFFFLAPDSAGPGAASREAARALWLRKALAASPAAWKIVYLLRSPYSSALGDEAKAPRWPFREWGADAVLSGRDGGYERLRIDGLTFIVNGPGGKPGASRTAERLPGSQCVFDEDAGALLIEADGSRIDFRYVTAEGVVVDAHTLRKGALAGHPSPARPASIRR
jgi:hypothetical protein